jgi:hypothetical protein
MTRQQSCLLKLPIRINWSKCVLFNFYYKGKQAGDAFISQGKTLEKGGEKDEAATAYVNASKAYKKTHPKGTWANIHV